MVFMVRALTSWGHEAEGLCLFSTAVCKVQAGKCYVGFLPLVLRLKRSCFSQGERFAVQLAASWLHVCPPEVGRLNIWHLETIYTHLGNKGWLHKWRNAVQGRWDIHKYPQTSCWKEAAPWQQVLRDAVTLKRRKPHTSNGVKPGMRLCVQTT